MAFSNSVKEKAWTRSGGRCESGGCTSEGGKKLCHGNHQQGQRGAYQTHHIKPVSRGGSDNLSNAKVVCLSCHSNTRSYCGKGKK